MRGEKKMTQKDKFTKWNISNKMWFRYSAGRKAIEKEINWKDNKIFFLYKIMGNFNLILYNHGFDLFQGDINKSRLFIFKSTRSMH